jgi:hypothetical protein
VIVHQPDDSRAARIVDEMIVGPAPGFRVTVAVNKNMAHGIKHVWRIWPATWLSPWSAARMIFPRRVKFWLGKASNLAKIITGFRRINAGQEKARSGKTTHIVSGGYNRM